MDYNFAELKDFDAVNVVDDFDGTAMLVMQAGASYGAGGDSAVASMRKSQIM